MKQMIEEDKQPSRRKTLNSLCSVSALLLSVVCCIAQIHEELRIQEHHRLMSHSVTFCDQMQTQILRKVQNYERWQFTKAAGLKGHLQGTNGEEQFYNSNTQLLSACFRSFHYENHSCLVYEHLYFHNVIPTTLRIGKEGTQEACMGSCHDHENIIQKPTARRVNCPANPPVSPIFQFLKRALHVLI